MKKLLSEFSIIKILLIILLISAAIISFFPCAGTVTVFHDFVTGNENTGGISAISLDSGDPYSPMFFCTITIIELIVLIFFKKSASFLCLVLTPIKTFLPYIIAIYPILTSNVASGLGSDSYGFTILGKAILWIDFINFILYIVYLRKGRKVI